MKKLIIAAAIVCAAVASQAATFSWGFSSLDIKDPTDEYIYGGTASLFINNVLIATAEQGPSYDFGVFDNSAVDTTGAVQALGRGDISESFVGQAYKLVLSYTDGDGVDWTYTHNGISSYNEVAGPAGEDSFNYEQFKTDYAIQASDWTQAVPEPTTGLLMLIGMGALALRRRRA